MILNKDFKEFIELLNENKVKYLIVGGYAVGFHGHPRYTKDLDIWILTSEENSKNILNAIHQFGFSNVGLKSKDFLNPDEFVQLGYPPNRIDLVMSCDGIEFNECYNSKVDVEIEGTKISFINLENLKKNKKATGRIQDKADLDNLKSK